MVLGRIHASVLSQEKPAPVVKNVLKSKIIIDSLQNGRISFAAGAAPLGAVGEGCSALQDIFLTRMRCLLPRSLNVRSLQSRPHTQLQLFNRIAAKGLRAHFEKSLLVHKGVRRGLVSAQPAVFHTHGLLMLPTLENIAIIENLQEKRTNRSRHIQVSMSDRGNSYKRKHSIGSLITVSDV